MVMRYRLTSHDVTSIPCISSVIRINMTCILKILITSRTKNTTVMIKEKELMKLKKYK